MKTNHYLILAGVALVGGYLWYRHKKQSKDMKLKTVAPVTSAEPTTEESSNFVGAYCRCKNGVSGYCKNGNCEQCCGDYGYKRSFRN